MILNNNLYITAYNRQFKIKIDVRIYSNSNNNNKSFNFPLLFFSSIDKWNVEIHLNLFSVFSVQSQTSYLRRASLEMDYVCE